MKTKLANHKIKGKHMTRAMSLKTKLLIALIILTGLVLARNLGIVYQVKDITGLSAGLVKNDADRLSSLYSVKNYLHEIEHELLNGDNTTKKLESIRLLAYKTLSEAAEYSELNNERGITVIPDLETKIVSINNDAIEIVNTEVGRNKDDKLLNEFQINKDALSVEIDRAITQTNNDISITATTLDKQSRRLINNSLIYAAVAVLIMITFGLVMISKLTNAIDRIKQAARRIANGDFSTHLAVTSRDEIGQLSELINEMAARLKESYRRLAVETQRDKAMLESMGEGVIAVDRDAKLVLINDAAIETLELPSRSAVISKTVYEVFSDADLRSDIGRVIELENTPILTTLRTSKRANKVIQYTNKTGGQTFLSAHSSPIMLEREIIGAIVTFRDVTKDKNVDRMKTEFISLASHQLRTPLSSIKWFVELLLSGDTGKLSDKQREVVSSVSESTERMIALVNDLLNISRIESGRIIVDPKPTNMKRLVEGIYKMLEPRTKDKRITYRLQAQDKLPEVNVDPRLLEEVCANLISNAVKYTPEKGSILVSLYVKDNEFVIEVSDNGYGIPVSQHQEVFSKFFRAHNIAHIETDGTGLGLYLVKEIVDTSGGKIWFDSTEGKGAKFYVSFPLSGMKPKKGEINLNS